MTDSTIIAKILSSADEFTKQKDYSSAIAQLVLALGKIEENMYKKGFLEDVYLGEIEERTNTLNVKVREMKRGNSNILENLIDLNERLTDLSKKTTVKHRLANNLTATMAIICFIGAILLITINLTGNTILGLNKTSHSLIGILLFIISLVTFNVYFKKRKTNKD